MKWLLTFFFLKKKKVGSLPAMFSRSEVSRSGERSLINWYNLKNSSAAVSARSGNRPMRTGGSVQKARQCLEPVLRSTVRATQNC